MTKIMSMTANAEKDFIEKMNQKQEEQHKKIHQHFEKRWQEARENHIKVEGSPDDDFYSFIKDIFIYGCNVGWNDCYKFHESIIQKGLNQS